MNEDSIRLLKEVNSGCKNATDSFGQVMEFVRDEKLKNLIDEYNKNMSKLETNAIRCSTITAKTRKIRLPWQRP